MTQEELFKILVAHCKEYGFIFPSSEIYDGLGAVYDYGQLGSELKSNIKRYWWYLKLLIYLFSFLKCHYYFYYNYWKSEKIFEYQEL